ncbi:class I SAM-dependent methyltransferase [Tellurirhabdus rosea]|uniref:class I SAM-dependent methyltransferase n=1 Tax=Tellurirhabdus rosea TaxID=2674997 RepID=UPI00224CABA0|nr:class I SAM-dependent methyltransferase [Tellurirhabdus rosea]
MDTKLQPVLSAGAEPREVYQALTEYQHAEDFKRLDFIVKQVQSLQKPDVTIMDIGCGNGNIARVLGGFGYSVLGVDIDPESIAEARKRNAFPNVRFEQMDAESLPTAGEFDVLVCSEVLEHLDVPGSLVETAYRLLKPGGRLIVTVPNGHGPREVLMTKPMQWINKKGYGDWLVTVKRSLGYANATSQSSNPDLTHIQFFSRTSLEALLKKHGFRPVTFAKANFIDRVFPYSLLANRLYPLQRLDCRLADLLPTNCASGFYTCWQKPVSPLY